MKCAICGVEFERTHGNRKYCSKKCRWRADRLKLKRKREANFTPVEKRCAYCYSTFTATTPYQVARQIYCNPLCSVHAWQERHRRKLRNYTRRYRNKTENKLKAKVYRITGEWRLPE